MKKNLILTAYFFISIFSITAQDELSLHFMSDNIAAARTNPALLPDNNLVIGLPNVGFNLYHSSGNFNDIFQDNPDGGLNVDFGKWIEGLSPENELATNLEVETVSFFLRKGKFGFQVNHEVRFHSSFLYPDTYPKLIGEGNAQYIGQRVNIGPEIQQDAYHSIGLGLSYQVNNKINLAVRPKILFGIGNTTTKRKDAYLETSDEFYQTTVTTDYQLNTTGILKYDVNGFDFDFESLSKGFSSNTGFALDLGIHIKPIDKLSINLSWIDGLAKINWKNNTQILESKGTKLYEGVKIDFSDILQGDSLNLTNATDTLNFDNLFNFTSRDGTYDTELPSRIYFSVGYQLTKKLSLHGLFYNENFRGKNRQAYSLGAQAQLHKMINLGVNYAYRFESATNIGLNTTIKLGPVQIFAATDNIIHVFQPFAADNVNGRIGLNLVF